MNGKGEVVAFPGARRVEVSLAPPPSVGQIDAAAVSMAEALAGKYRRITTLLAAMGPELVGAMTAPDWLTVVEGGAVKMSARAALILDTLETAEAALVGARFEIAAAALQGEGRS